MLGTIEQLVVFAAGHIREIGQIGDDCSGPILAVEAQQRALLREGGGAWMSAEWPAFARRSSSRYRPLPGLPKLADPLIRMHL